MRRLTFGLLIVTVTLVAFAAGSVTAGRAWDGCTARSGDLRFRAADGTRLVGHRFGRGRTAIVLAHQTNGNLCQWRSYSKRLAGLGYLAFPFDLRNYGQSQTRRYRSGEGPGVDVAAAVNLVRRLGAKKVFLVGASLGGSAVLAGGATVRPQVDGVVSVSGAADLAKAIESVPRLHAPVLFLAGKYDVEFAREAQRLYDSTASDEKTLKILLRGEHGTQLVGTSLAARRLIEGFVAGH
ncbi:MAG TPA: alpha/beta fold hydrolase [Gaiellaceae bacterium]|nr:alpha/beta fold hydrolase [Gaiellaceae bacterium]